MLFFEYQMHLFCHVCFSDSATFQVAAVCSILTNGPRLQWCLFFHYFVKTILPIFSFPIFFMSLGCKFKRNVLESKMCLANTSCIILCICYAILYYVADADIRNLKSIHTLLAKYLHPMLVKLEPRKNPQIYKIVSFLTING